MIKLQPYHLQLALFYLYCHLVQFFVDSRVRWWILIVGTNGEFYGFLNSVVSMLNVLLQCHAHPPVRCMGFPNFLPERYEASCDTTNFTASCFPVLVGQDNRCGQGHSGLWADGQCGRGNSTLQRRLHSVPADTHKWSQRGTDLCIDSQRSLCRRRCWLLGESTPHPPNQRSRCWNVHLLRCHRVRPWWQENRPSRRFWYVIQSFVAILVFRLYNQPLWQGMLCPMEGYNDS